MRSKKYKKKQEIKRGKNTENKKKFPRKKIFTQRTIIILAGKNSKCVKQFLFFSPNSIDCTRESLQSYFYIL